MNGTIQHDTDQAESYQERSWTTSIERFSRTDEETSTWAWSVKNSHGYVRAVDE